MSEERIDQIDLGRLVRQLRENDAAIEKLAMKFDELVRFSVSVDERVEELGESVTDLRLSNPDALAKASDRSHERLKRQGVKFRQERRASLLRR